MIIKSFVALGIISSINAIYVDYLPQEVIENGKQLRQSGKMLITKDYNTTKYILKRLRKKENRGSPAAYITES